MSDFLGKYRLYLLGLLGLLIIIIVAFLAYRSHLSSTNSMAQIPYRAPMQVVYPPSTLTLTADSKSVKVGQNLSIKINASSSQRSDGFDIILLYDPKMVSVVPFSATNTVKVGAIYDQYPINIDDITHGRILFSGITNNAVGVIPNGVLGTATFKAKKAGVAQFSIYFIKKGATNDSNLTAHHEARDLLDSVRGVTVNILGIK